MSASDGAAGVGDSQVTASGPAHTSDLSHIHALLGAAAVGLTILLACLSLWFVLDPFKYVVVAAQRQAQPVADALFSELVQLPTASWLLVGATALLAVATVLLELRTRAVSAALSGDVRAACHLILLAALLWFGHSYLYPGHLLGGDSGAHIARVAHFAAGLREGELRHWDNSFYGGATLLQFTGPLFFWLAGVTALLVDDAVAAVKIVLLALHFGSGWALYRLLRHWELSRPAAMAGSIVYAGAFAHLHLMLYKGALPQAVTLALLPVLFLCADRLASAFRHCSFAWATTGISVAAVVVAHQPHGLTSGVYLAVYVLVNLIFRRYPAATVWRFASAAILAALLCSFAVVPWLVEGRHVMGGNPGTPVFWDWPDVDYFKKLLVWSNRWTSVGAESAAYLGLSAVALAMIGIGGAFRAGCKRRQRLIILTFAALLLVSFGLRGDFVRDILFTLFFIGVLAAFGAERLLESWNRAPRLALAVLLLVVADLGPASIQPLARTDKNYLDVAGAYLAESGSRRVVLMHDYTGSGTPESIAVRVGPSSIPVSYYPVQTLSGPHNMAATHLHNYAVAILKRAESDLRENGTLSPATLQLLAMLNVDRIVSDNGTGMGLPAGISGLVEDGPLGSVLRVPDPTPVLFAARLVTMAPPPGADHPPLWGDAFGARASAQAQAVDRFLDDVVSAMAFVPENASATAIPIRPDQPAVRGDWGATEPLPDDAVPLQVVDYKVEAQRVVLQVRVASAGYVQLAHPWYPFQSVEIDGHPAETLRGTLNLLVLPIEAGEHVITVTAYRSNLRRILGGGTVLLLVGVLAVAGIATRREVK